MTEILTTIGEAVSAIVDFVTFIINSIGDLIRYVGFGVSFITDSIGFLPTVLIGGIASFLAIAVVLRVLEVI